MTEDELIKQMDYWMSEYDNSESRADRELYIKVYTSLRDVYDKWHQERLKKNDVEKLED